jgi:nicotinamide mononucleotide transporter
VGDIVMIPLLLYKGYAISSFQYLFLTILAIMGLMEWRKNVVK